MGYLTARQFSEIWQITERRIIKLCKEGRISGAIKNGMVWEIPEETLKPSDKRSSIYQYINIKKVVMIVNAKKEQKEYLIELLEKQGYEAECNEFDKIKNSVKEQSKYYEGLIYFSNGKIEKQEEEYIQKFASRLHSESSIVIVDYKKQNRNKIEEKLASQFKQEIGLKINTLLLDISKDKEVVIDEKGIVEDIIELLTKFKNTAGMAIVTDGGKIEFDKNRRTKNLEVGEFYRVINQHFRELNKESYLWCASMMLEDEWTEEPQEMKFRVINLEVANRGVKVERIFIFSKDKIKQYKDNKTLKIYKQSNIKTLFVDYNEIKEKAPNLLKILADGWDGINQDTLIVDLPSESHQRGYVSKNTEEVMRAYDCFQELKKYATDLKEVF